MTHAERFLEAVSRNYRENPADLSFLFHPEGSLLLPGSDTPIPQSEIPAMIARQHAAVPDIEQVITNWAERDGVIFHEWETTGTIRGRKVTLRGVNRNYLRGSRSIEAVSYFDRLALIEAADPERSRTDLLAILERLG